MVVVSFHHYKCAYFSLVLRGANSHFCVRCGVAGPEKSCSPELLSKDGEGTGAPGISPAPVGSVMQTTVEEAHEDYLYFRM